MLEARFLCIDRFICLPFPESTLCFFRFKAHPPRKYVNVNKWNVNNYTVQKQNIHGGKTILCQPLIVECYNPLDLQFLCVFLVYVVLDIPPHTRGRVLECGCLTRDVSSEPLYKRFCGSLGILSTLSLKQTLLCI